jgi:hypothetical protein
LVVGVVPRFLMKVVLVKVTAIEDPGLRYTAPP